MSRKDNPAPRQQTANDALAAHDSAGQIGLVTANSDAPRAPYALDPTAFPFPALATLAGRAALGGPREIVLGCFLVARVAVDATVVNGPLTGDQKRVRAKHVADWLSATTIPGGVKGALVRLAEATAAEDRGAMSAAVDSVMTVTASHLDPSARLELGRLAQAVEK